MNITKILTATVVVVGFTAANAFAEETTTNKVKDQVGDAKVSAKKAYRSTKRSVRKATGTDSAAKDLKDVGGDMHDSISNGADKMKHKAE